MLPTTASKGRTPTRTNPVFPQYLRRIVKLDGSNGVWVDNAAVLGSSEGKESQWGGGIDAGYVLAIKKVGQTSFRTIVLRISKRLIVAKMSFRLQNYFLVLSYFFLAVQWQQMDIEYTFWQMLHLCTSPKVVYQHTKYHKQTKNQWARDDPAFIVICSLLLAVSTLAYCAAYDHSAGHTVFVVLSVTCFHFLIVGALLATFCWFLTNTYLREEAPNSHVVEQRVEWLYAFDVHCNSFFPLFVMLYVVHYFLSPLLVAHGFIPTLLSNLLFMTAASYYHYLNFLGYDVLPFLERTTFFLYPIGIVIILSPIFTLSGFNPSRYIMNIYFSQWS